MMSVRFWLLAAGFDVWWTLAPDLRDPLRTTSAGTGELIRAALDAGARRFILGVGGSATDDAGKVTSSSVFGIDLASPSETVEISIQDASGKTVRTMSMANAEVGTYPITWDGTKDDKTAAAAGSYTFTVKATNAGKTLTDATPLQLAAVASVSTGSAGVKLNTSLGHFTMADIKEVL